MSDGKQSKYPFRPQRGPALIAAAITAGVVTLVLALRTLDTLELPVRDTAMRVLSPRAAEATFVVAIDELSIRRLGPWPWPRTLLAEIVERAGESGARAIVFDVLLAEARDGVTNVCDGVPSGSSRDLADVAA